ncbi:hypothetical protein F4775DRAFT_245361 [Biscogniauxia sp. FL1348]|nr:hypothetical protein F4775DRAFT_245361 [Biscogniauxia sp. FL1348]
MYIRYRPIVPPTPLRSARYLNLVARDNFGHWTKPQRNLAPCRLVYERASCILFFYFLFFYSSITTTTTTTAITITTTTTTTDHYHHLPLPPSPPPPPRLNRSSQESSWVKRKITCIGISGDNFPPAETIRSIQICRANSKPTPHLFFFSPSPPFTIHTYLPTYYHHPHPPSSFSFVYAAASPTHPTSPTPLPTPRLAWPGPKLL